MVSKALLCALMGAACLLAACGQAPQTQTFISTSGTGQASGSASASTTPGGTITSTIGQPSTVTTTTAPIPPPPQAQPPAPAPAVQLPATSTTLEPFSSIFLCAPINLLITPNATGRYAFTVEAEDAVRGSINATVNTQTGQMTIAAYGPFATNQTVKLTASLPAGNLTAISHYGPSEFLSWEELFSET